MRFDLHASNESETMQILFIDKFLSINISPEYSHYYSNFLKLQKLFSVLGIDAFKFAQKNRIETYFYEIENVFEKYTEYTDTNCEILEKISTFILDEIDIETLSLTAYNKYNENLASSARRIEEFDIETKSTLKKLNTEIQTQFKKLGLGAFGKKYADLADESENLCHAFGIAALFSVIILVCIFFEFYKEAVYMDTINNQKLLSVVLARLTIFVFLVLCFVMCIKLYRLERNNVLLNRHKALVTETYELFMNSAPNEEVKSALLHEAAQSLFHFQSTGFTGDSSIDMSQVERAVKIAQPFINKTHVPTP